jgi:hypothetical protein
MKKITILSVSLVCVLASSCATIIKGPSQEVKITTAPIQKAHCTLTNAEGNWSATTPATVNIKKSKTDLQIDCEDTKTKSSGSEAVDSGVEQWTFANIILGGLVGLGIDWLTGSVHKYDDDVNVTLHKESK